MTEELARKIKMALERSWSEKTSVCYSQDAAASYGQCAPTAIVVREAFGGEILKTDGWPPNGRHFYNHIDRVRYDFTADQFEMSEYSHTVEYKDILSSAEEAATETLPGQIDAMRPGKKPKNRLTTREHRRKQRRLHDAWLSTSS
jgi:hypothetical protein